MLKWLEELRGTTGKSSSTSDTTSPKATTCTLSIIDLDADSKVLSLMNDETGDTYDNIPLPNDEELGRTIKISFETTEDVVSVTVVLDEDGTAVPKIVGLA